VEADPQRSQQERKVCLDLRLPASAGMVSTVRRALGELPLPPSVLEDARLLTSELVTNSVRHAGLRAEDRIRVRAELSGTTLRVDVIDRARDGAADPVAGAIRPAPGAESGWGLYLVDRLAARWGRAPGRYWFELPSAARGSRRASRPG
jgi:anti-sigma regulatory factor (Ser/Thr protein kinase)